MQWCFSDPISFLTLLAPFNRWRRIGTKTSPTIALKVSVTIVTGRVTARFLSYSSPHSVIRDTKVGAAIILKTKIHRAVV